MILQKCEKKYIATLASHEICDYSGRNKAYRGYLATEFIFSLIIFSITIYIFSFFIVNVSYMEKKLDDRDKLDYVMGKALLEERSYLKKYKGDYEDLDLVSTHRIDGKSIEIKRVFKDKRFGWVESELIVYENGTNKKILLHTIIGLE